MKRMLGWCLLLGIIGSPLAVLGKGENWTKPEQEVADVFTAWADAELAGDVEREMSLLAPAFTAWDFAQPAPMDRAAFRQMTIDLFKQAKVVEFSIAPTMIKLDRRTAVAHGNYAQTLQEAAGAKKSVQGPWTASLIRDGNKWLVLGLGWSEQRPVVDEAALRTDVTKALHEFIAACERADFSAAWRSQLGGPEYMCVDLVGKQLDAPTAEKIWSEFFAHVTAMKFDMANEQVLVFGADMALAHWHGKVAATMKDGAVLRYDPFTFVALYRLTPDGWRIARYQQSALVPQRAKSAATMRRTPDELAAAFVQAVNQHDAPALAALYTEDQITMLPAPMEPIGGRAARQEMAENMLRAFPDLMLENPLVVVSGDHVVCSAVWSGTNLGPRVSKAGEKPATGRHVSLPVAIVLQLTSEGMIRLEQVYYDAGDFRRQLEGPAAPATPAELSMTP